MSEELKPFQKVLVRDNDARKWEINLFERIVDGKYLCLAGAYHQCIPYNEETAHLLGTTDSPTPPEPEFKFGDKVEVSDDNKTWFKSVYYKSYTETRNVHVVMIEEIGLLSYKFCRHADW